MEDRPIPQEQVPNKKNESSEEEKRKTMEYFRTEFARDMKMKALFYSGNIALATMLIIVVLFKGFQVFRDAEIYSARMNGKLDSVVQIAIKNKIDSSEARFNH